MLFMKGSSTEPKCGFSRKMVELLTANDIKFTSFDILKDQEVRVRCLWESRPRWLTVWSPTGPSWSEGVLELADVSSAVRARQPDRRPGHCAGDGGEYLIFLEVLFLGSQIVGEPLARQ